MAESRMSEVASELLRLSKANKLSWQKSIRDKGYRVILPDVAFRIHCDGNFDSRFRLELIDYSGEVVASLESSDDEAPTDRIGDLAAQPGEVSQQHQQLKEIFQLAENYVRDEGITKALQNLKQA